MMTLRTRSGIALLATLWLSAYAHADSGLRLTTRPADDGFPGKLRVSALDSTYPFSNDRWSSFTIGRTTDINLVQPTLRADWYPFGSGLRTSAGMLWADPGISGNTTANWRNETFLGLGWTASASSSSTGSGWQLNADVGASRGLFSDCGRYGKCASQSGAGLRPGGSGEGIRWNPYISIGASLFY
ncbi:hypothetical protein [Viridibacterium curvum]